MTQVTRLTLEEDGSENSRQITLHDITGDLDAPLETVGQDLRATRIRRGDDLNTASRALKIRKEHLEALEEDRLEALPGRTYAVGFVRSYADYLGLDPVLYVERYKAEIAGRNDTATPKVQVIDEDEHKKLPQGWGIIAGVVLLLVAYGAFKLMEKADDTLKVGEPQNMTAQVVPKPKPPATVAPVSQKPAQAPTPVPTAPATAPPDGTPGADAVAPSPSLQAQTTALPQSGPLPQGHVWGAQNRNARVVLRALLPVRVVVLPPKGSPHPWLLNETLQPGDIYRVPNMVGLKLAVSNASAVEVTLDGQPIGRIGRTVDPVDGLSLDPQAMMDRINNR